LIGARVETRRLSAMGQGESTCTAPPKSRQKKVFMKYLICSVAAE
jgi:hypothetical protein